MSLQTGYISSKAKLLFTLPKSGFATLTMNMVSSGAASLVMYSLARGSPVTIYLTALINVIASALEPALLSRVCRRETPYASTRRIAFSLFFSNTFWLIGLALAYALARLFNVAWLVMSLFLMWSARLFTFGAIFTNGIVKGVALASMLPTLNLALLTVYPGARGGYYNGLVAGVVLLSASALGLLAIDRSLRHNSRPSGLRFFRSFLKAWVSGDSRELEEFIASYSLRSAVEVYVVEETGSGVRLIIPYVHPGPLKGVSGFDLPQRICEEMDSQGYKSVVFHGPVGHEFNLATTSDKSTLLDSMKANYNVLTRGELSAPVIETGDNLRVFGLWVGSDSLIVFVEPTRGMDDFPPDVLKVVEDVAREKGVRLVLVDAHNSLGPNPGGGQLKELRLLLEKIIDKGPPGLRITNVGYGFARAHRSKDISKGGVRAIALLDNKGALHALVSVDSNNSLPGVRSSITRRLLSIGARSVIFCTTDTHFNAAGVVSNAKGYLALGEATRAEVVVSLVETAFKNAIRSLVRAGSFTLGVWRVGVRVSGAWFMDTAYRALRTGLRRLKSTILLLSVIAVALYALL